jgi:quercetin dioxygenase-like cupin family protein
MTLRPYMVGPGEGSPSWMLNALLATKARGADTGGGFSLFEFYADHNGEPPPHIHRHEDEAWYVLEGDVVFTVGDDVFTARPGAFVFGPRDVVHSLRITSPVARMLTIMSPAGFESFFDGLSLPAASAGLPQPGAPDMELLLRLAEAHGCEFVHADHRES